MTGTNHTGGSQDGQSNCASCHTHDDTAGSWDASAICDSCHGQPPVSLATQFADYSTYFENKTPHNRHASPRTNPAAPTLVGYAYPCQMCHNQWTNSTTHDTGEEAYGHTYASIWFDTAFNPLAAAYGGSPTTTPDYNQGTTVCANVYCHSDGSSGNAVGTARWMSGQQTPDYYPHNSA